MTKPTFYITTAISYANGNPHIGHAYEMIATDAIARFKRLDGFEVHFLTGTDEYGLKMSQTAHDLGIPVEELAETNSARFKALAAALNISNDDFIQTTEERHAKACQALWRKMLANGDIYEDVYAGWYSVRDEAYYDESELSIAEGGHKVSPQGTPVEWLEEPSYFFRLSAFSDRLLAHFEAHPEFLEPRERRNEVVSFVKSGLRDLSMSRTTFDWGVPVPDAPGHVMYVWVDALTNYISALGYPDTDSENFKKFWPADVHVIGKDIVRFHAIYWPAFLMSAGISLPKSVFGHGFVTSEGKKMSKSLGNVIDPFELVEEFGIDPVRYYFLREISFGQDGDYGREKFINRNNADLANDLGNLVQRSLSMVAKNCEGVVPEPGELTAEDKAILNACGDAIDAARDAIDRQQLHDAASAIWAVVGEANRYFAAQEPWALKKSDPARMATVLYVTAETIRRMAIPAAAMVPSAANHILDLLAVDAADRLIARANDAGKLVPGKKLPAPTHAFQRIDRPEQA